MKQKFSKTWKASKRPGKQRKYVANAPLHLKKKFVSVNLSKDLRKKYGKRNIPVIKNDKVKVMRGKYKGKQGKVLKVKLKISKIILEGIQVNKKDGSKADVKMQPSNLQIIELNLEDKKRAKKLGAKVENTRKSKISGATKSKKAAEAKDLVGKPLNFESSGAKDLVGKEENKKEAKKEEAKDSVGKKKADKTKSKENKTKEKKK